jgi:hypothetical protein
MGHPARWLTLGPSSVKRRPPRDDNPNQDQNQIGFKVEGSGQECRSALGRHGRAARYSWAAGQPGRLSPHGHLARARRADSSPSLRSRVGMTKFFLQNRVVARENSCED